MSSCSRSSSSNSLVRNRLLQTTTHACDAFMRTNDAAKADVIFGDGFD